MELVDPNTPYLQNGGTVSKAVSPSKRSSGFVEMPSNEQQRRHAASVRRRLEEIPASPRQLNIVSVVCMYTLIGLDDEDIAAATGLPSDQIARIRMLDAYQYVYDATVDAIVSEDVNDVRNFLVAKAQSAANRVVQLMEESEFDQVKLSAARDILDRAGHRPADIVEHRHTMEGELRIRHIHEDPKHSLELDLEPEDVT